MCEPRSVACIVSRPHNCENDGKSCSCDAFCRSTRGYGLKDVRDLERLAADVGLACTTPRAMPANNLLLRFVKAERGPLQKMLSWAGVEELVL